MKYIIPLFAVILLGAGCAPTDKTTYTPIYFPNGCEECDESIQYGPTFATIEECTTWATNKKESTGTPTDTFTCGENCVSKGEFSVCEE